MVYGNKRSLSYSEAVELLGKWLLWGNLRPMESPPLMVYSKPGFAIINLLEDAMEISMKAVKGTYTESVGERTKAFVNYLEHLDSQGVLHKLATAQKVKKLFNAMESSEVPTIYTVTPSFLLEKGFEQLMLIAERSPLALIHVHNALDGVNDETLKLYTAIIERLTERVTKPVLLSQQLVPGVSKRRISLAMSVGGLGIINVDLPTVEEWAKRLEGREGVDQDVVDFVKLISPEYMVSEPFSDILEELNSRIFGVGDPFKAEELQVVEVEGVKAEWAPVLGRETEVLPSPDAWTQVSTLPWHFQPLASDLAEAILGSSQLVEVLTFYKKRAKGVIKYLKDLESSIPSGKVSDVLQELIEIVRSLGREWEGDVIASAMLLKALSVIYGYAEKFENWEECGEACIALRVMCELLSALTDAGGENLRKVVEEARVILVELTGMGAEKACAKLKLMVNLE